MTPLAYELLEDVTHKIHIRHSHSFADVKAVARILRRLVHNCKFFECTAVWPLIGTLANSMHESFEQYDRIDQRLAFLPATETWVEYEFPTVRHLFSREQTINQFLPLTQEQIEKAPYTYRVAFVFLGDQNSTNLARRFRISIETPRILPGPRIWRIQQCPPLPLVNSGLKPQRLREHKFEDHVRHYDEPVSAVDDFIDYAALSLINSPRIVGQQIHLPHRRIERDKLKQLGLKKFPLRAWTEILLRVTPNPEDRSTDPPLRTDLTGERCLHYCRTYLQVRLGMLEYVEGHWRGNPALGVKRSRYRLENEAEPPHSRSTA